MNSHPGGNLNYEDRRRFCGLEKEEEQKRTDVESQRKG